MAATFTSLGCEPLGAGKLWTITGSSGLEMSMTLTPLLGHIPEVPQPPT